MKTILALAVFFASVSSTAATKTLLYCKNIGRDDLKEILIQEASSGKTLEVQEYLPNGENKVRTISSQDFAEGYVPLSQNDSGERTLIKKDGNWEISGSVGDYKYSAHAECAE